MTKLRFVAYCLLLCLTASPLLLWWLATDREASIAPTPQWQQGDIKRIKQLLRANSKNGGRELSLDQRDLLRMMHYGIAQYALPLNADIELHDTESLLQLSIDTQSPLRRYLNLQLAFTIDGKTLRWHRAQIGRLSLPEAGLAHLQTWLWPTLKQALPAAELDSLWQSVDAINIQAQSATVYFKSATGLASDLQQQQLQLLFGKNALQRLPHYQHFLEQQFAEQGRKRLSLGTAMQRLFAEAERQQQADTISEHKAIILSLFLHTANHRHFAGIDLPKAIKLPAQPLRFSLEGRQDLAQHLLATATITLFANSAIADSIGLYKELEDQQAATGFDVRDLIADQAGSLLATRLTADTTEALRLRRRLATLQDERELFPASRQLAAKLQLQLLGSERADAAAIQALNQAIGEHLRGTAIYQQTL